MDTIMRKTKLLLLMLTIVLSGCSLNPGLKGLPNNTDMNLVDLNLNNFSTYNEKLDIYKISVGDMLAIVVFGLEEVFPTTAMQTSSSPFVNRTVDENGEIFFPFVGTVRVEGLTVSEIRSIITEKLSGQFKDPQIDVSVVKFNDGRNIYLIGEVVRPKTLAIGLTPITLADAISQAEGLSPITSNPRAVYIARRSGDDGDYGLVFKVNLENISEFSGMGKFNLMPGDIVYAGPADITRWNRFISQLFPFTSLFNQVNNLD